jgi:NAD(P)-dependent dehydrogenase (short-subunit alcohol dehydrogenase family)
MYKKLLELENKLIVVTGGTGLLGKEFCRGLAEFGAHIIIGSINEEKGKLLSEELNKRLGNHNVSYKHLDITSEESVTNFITEISDESGEIDVLVNNAYPRNKEYGKLFEDVPFSSYEENILSHMGGYFLVSQRVSERMMHQKSGVIINIASIYGFLGPNFSVYEGTPMTMPVEYSMIKGGIINFTRYLSTYLAPYNIRVNSISPGGIFDNQPSSFVKSYSEKVPLGHMAEPSDIVGTLIFLSSDASKYITGQNIIVDGGLSVW